MNRKIRRLATLALAGTVAMTSCAHSAEETTVVTTSEITTATEPDVSETTEEIVTTDNSLISGTNGELEGQLDYMMLRSDYDGPVDARECAITDASVFEDDDLREAAQYYLDQGYLLFDEGGQLDLWGPLGDDEYMFDQGFFAYTNGASGESGVWVYRMNETLFEHFLVEVNGFDPEDVSDDGIIISCSTFDRDEFLTSEISFDRETGIGSYSYTYDFSEWYDGEVTVVDEIENEALRETVRSYAERGYNLLNYNLITILGEEIEDKVGELEGYGIRAFWQDQENNLEYYVYIYSGDNDLFDATVTSGVFADEVYREETEDTIIVCTSGYDHYEYVEYTIEYDIDAQVIIVTHVVGYDPNTWVLLTRTGNQSTFQDLVDEYTGHYGAEIDRIDDGPITRVYFRDEYEDNYRMLEFDREHNRISIAIVTSYDGE
jgi:hypothetical protein